MYKIFLAGGFGNNLFQICLGEYLKSKGQTVVYNRYLTKKNFLTRFLGWSCHNDELTNDVLKGLEVEETLGFLDCVFLFREFFKSKFFGDKNYIFFENVDEEKNEYKRMWGYFAIGNHLTSKNIDSFKSFLKLKLKGSSISKSDDYCVVHVRKGDFKNDALLNLDYYKEALKFIDSKLPIVLVTDSPDIKENFEKELACKFLELGTGSVYDDFLVIASATEVISSNSTFCYWGAVLGNARLIIHPDKISYSKSWFFPYQNRHTNAISTSFGPL